MDDDVVPFGGILQRDAVTDVAGHVPEPRARRTALEARDVVAPTVEGDGDRAAQHAGRSGDEHPAR